MLHYPQPLGRLKVRSKKILRNKNNVMYLTKATEHKLIRLDNDKDRWNNPRGGYVAKKAEGKGQLFEIWKGESPLYSFSIFHLIPRVRAGAQCLQSIEIYIHLIILNNLLHFMVDDIPKYSKIKVFKHNKGISPLSVEITKIWCILSMKFANFGAL